MVYLSVDRLVKANNSRKPTPPGQSFTISLGMIFLILVLQSNSEQTLSSYWRKFFLSHRCVPGFAFTGMTMPTIMVLVGVIGLAEYYIKTVSLLEFQMSCACKRNENKRRPSRLVKSDYKYCFYCSCHHSGLIPLAIGFNIDFWSLVTHLDPKIFIGGDSVVFWGPLAWTIIFGFIFSFFLTLLMIPSMYVISERLRRPMVKPYGTKFIAFTRLF